MNNKLSNKKRLILLTTFLLINGCAHQAVDQRARDPLAERSISSESSIAQTCAELIKKFLPANERAQPATFVKSAMPETAVKSFLPREVKQIEKDVDNEATSLFNTFTEVSKDLAVKGKFKLLVDPHEALIARIMLIRNAKRSIDLTYYIFQDSETSKILIGELRAALRRGVDVRLMVDGSGSIGSSFNFFKEIQTLTHTVGGNILDDAGNVVGKAKFEALVINPTFNVRASIKKWYNKITKVITGKEVPLDSFSIFHRSHDKILLIDATSAENSMAIIGGRNISNHYYKIGTTEERDSSFNDLDILVKNIAFTESKDEGEVVRNVLLEHFNRLYYYSANKNFEDFIFKESRIKMAPVLNQIRKTRNELVRNNEAELAAVLKRMESENFLNSDMDHGYVAFLDEIENLIRRKPLQNLGYDNNENSIIATMREQVQKAEKDILICSPYIYLTDKEIDFLASWLKTDPSRKLRLITNSSATSDNLFAQSMVENFVMPKLLKKLKDLEISNDQFEVLAYGNLDNKEFGGKIPQGKLHAKFWMVDNYSIGVGTSNFDPISRWTNSEIVANVFPTKGKQTVKSINEYYKTLKANSSKWDSDDFLKAKFRPELKKKLMIQSFLAKVMERFNILPQDP